MPYTPARSPFAGNTLRMVNEARQALGVTRESLRALPAAAPA